MAKDILIFFSGVQGKTNEQDMAEGGKEVGDNEQGIFEEMKKIPKRSGRDRIDKGWYGSIILLKGTNAAYDFVTHCADYIPNDTRLVIYGYSAGGYNALTLCRHFDAYNKGNAGRLAPTEIAVDLLVTVDAAARGLTSTIDRKVGDCVKRNVNYYEKTVILGDILGRSEGGPNTGKCAPLNINLDSGHWIGPKHGEMQDLTMPQALLEIKKAFGVT